LISTCYKIAGAHPINARPFQIGRRFDVGAFSVKPYLMDHSAFDAAAFGISAGGRTVIYPCDFCGHGRKPKCLDNFIKYAAKQADALLTEGTKVATVATVSGGDERVMMENELEAAVVKELKGSPSIGYSSPPASTAAASARGSGRTASRST
jgi:ribonuclease J